ncbi:hypothetical protein V1506DRAFT_557773 [Lipomyces tetrasporus]
MRLECHWRILKRDYASHLIRPRLDVLTYIICTGLVPSRIHLYLQVEAGRVKPNAIDERVDDRNLYHADKRNWYSGRAPPRCTQDLFQERLPLIRFDDDFDVSGTENSSNYLEELKSLQLLPSEDPEAKEKNDERLYDFLPNPETLIWVIERYDGQQSL